MDGLRKKLIVCLVLTLLTIAYVPVYWLREAARQQAALARVEAQSVERGREAYLGLCASCHGERGRGGIGPSLTGGGAALIRATVRSGKGIMPAFGTAQIGDGELDDIGRYVGTLGSQTKQPVASPAPPTTKPPATGDAVSKGRELFRSAGGIACSVCHGDNARG